jgi:hypothetical protein
MKDSHRAANSAGRHPSVQGVASPKPRFAYYQCARCAGRLDEERSMFGWLCSSCYEAEKNPEPTRSLKRTTLKPIR